MARLHIVRHGQTVENLQRILQGHLPGTLTPEGRKQMERSAQKLAESGVSFRCIVASDLKRAMDSARIIADKLHLPIVPMQMLRERDWGKWTGMTIAEATDRFRKDGKWRFPEGTTETEEGIYQRAAEALDALREEYAEGDVIVLTHGQFARNMVAAHFGCNYHEVNPFVNAEIRILNL